MGDDLLAALAAEAGLPLLTPEEAEAVLHLAREVAHGSERRFAPLTAYAAGLALGAATDAASRRGRIEELTAMVRRLTGGD